MIEKEKGKRMEGFISHLWFQKGWSGQRKGDSKSAMEESKAFIIPDS